ncbi:MAG: N-acetylglucosamine-6-phosphate deacetylase [Synergistaceae bacterium]|nr:N-acetylglucosamine-6-phosphate deacetylase [Synergistota bacterium]NLM70759.1 N-acetylglucosamine-6-phosphate deacetylase [Synergistaceae bacterium]
MKALAGSRIVAGRSWFDGLALLFDERVIDFVPEAEIPSGAELLDAGGAWIVPGFIDVHVHGGLGSDAMDAEAGSLETIAAGLAAHGVTAFCPTTMTMSSERIEAALDAVKVAKGAVWNGATVLGAHLEGPFISPGRVGAQDGTHVRRPDPGFVRRWSDVLRLVTFAPEEDEAFSLLKALREEGIVPSIGHSQATYEQAMQAFDRGASSVTHLFNGMPPFHHREPGLVGAALDADVFCELIADGVHSHTAVFRLLHKIKGLDRVVLVSDAMRGAGLGDGERDLGGQRVMVRGRRALLADGTIAGSVLTLDVAMKNYACSVGLPLWEAVRLVSANPAKLIGERHRGRLEPGYYADFALLDDDWSVIGTYIGGKEVFNRNAHCNRKGL